MLSVHSAAGALWEVFPPSSYSGQSDSKVELCAAPSVSLKMPKVERSSSPQLRWHLEGSARFGKFSQRSSKRKRVVIWHPKAPRRDTSCYRKSFSMSTINVLFTPGGFNQRDAAINTRSIDPTCEWIIKVFMSRIKINHPSDHDTSLNRRK